MYTYSIYCIIGIVYTDDYFDLTYDKNIIDYNGSETSAR